MTEQRQQQFCKELLELCAYYNVNELVGLVDIAGEKTAVCHVANGEQSTEFTSIREALEQIIFSLKSKSNDTATLLDTATIHEYTRYGDERPGA